MSLSVIIPACNEAGYIGACLEAVLASDAVADLQVVVAANGCTDSTVPDARTLAPRFANKGWQLDVLDLPGLGKPGALDAGDQAAKHAMRAYLDADVIVSPPLLAQVIALLSTDDARYASGTPIVTARSFISRAYARFWVKLPFVARGVPGFGLFAVNAAGRARWDEFPKIISDDTFVRIQFTPDERVKASASYQWPLIEGFSKLVKVRRRQDQGVAELNELHPDMMANEGKDSPSKAWLLGQAVRDPIAFGTYLAVTLAVKAGFARQDGWVRGR